MLSNVFHLVAMLDLLATKTKQCSIKTWKSRRTEEVYQGMVKQRSGRA